MLELTEKPLEEQLDEAENGMNDVELETEEDAAEPGEEFDDSEHQLLESTTPSTITDQPDLLKEDSAQNIQSNLTPQDVQRAKKIRVSPFGGFKIIHTYIYTMFVLYVSLVFPY